MFRGGIGSFLFTLYNLLTCNDLFFHLWYVICFVLLLLLIPYINIIISNINRKDYKKILIYTSVLYILSSSINDFVGYDFLYGYTGKSFTDMGCFNFIIFIIMYLIGGYIGKYSISVRRPGLIFIILSSLTAGLTYWYSFTGGFKFLVKEMLGYEAQYESYHFYEAFCKYNNVLVVLMTIFLFLYFKDLKIKNKFINKLSNGVYGGYLIHTCFLSFVFYLYQADNSVYPYYNYNISSVGVLFSLCFIIYILSLSSSLFCDKFFLKWLIKH